MKYLVFVLAYFLMVDVCWGQCNMANWWYSFDKKGWSLCDSTMEYMTGMERNTNRGDNDKIYLLEKAKCCQAPSPNNLSPELSLMSDSESIEDHLMDLKDIHFTYNVNKNTMLFRSVFR